MTAQADVNAANADGWTALHQGAWSGNTAVVQLLLSAHAAVNAACVHGTTALHPPAHHGHIAVIQILLDAHADVNAADGEGQTPLHSAAADNQSEAVQLLLAVPQLSTEAMAAAAEAAAAHGHLNLAVLVLTALMARDMPTAAVAAVLAHQSVADAVLGRWLAAEDTVKELEVRWLEVQQLTVGAATTHQQLQRGAGDIATSAVLLLYRLQDKRWVRHQQGLQLWRLQHVSAQLLPSRVWHRLLRMQRNRVRQQQRWQQVSGNSTFSRQPSGTSASVSSRSEASCLRSAWLMLLPATSNTRVTTQACSLHLRDAGGCTKIPAQLLWACKKMVRDP
jgi:ankyrin repeat protein